MLDCFGSLWKKAREVGPELSELGLILFCVLSVKEYPATTRIHEAVPLLSITSLALDRPFRF